MACDDVEQRQLGPPNHHQGRKPNPPDQEKEKAVREDVHGRPENAFKHHVPEQAAGNGILSETPERLFK